VYSGLAIVEQAMHLQEDGFHRDVLDAERVEPVGQFQKARRGGWTSCNGAPSPTMRAQATTVCLCTSNPAQRGQMTSMIASVVAGLRRHRRAAHVIEV